MGAGVEGAYSLAEPRHARYVPRLSSPDRSLPSRNAGANLRNEAAIDENHTTAAQAGRAWQHPVARAARPRPRLAQRGEHQYALAWHMAAGRRYRTIIIRASELRRWPLGNPPAGLFGASLARAATSAMQPVFLAEPLDLRVPEREQRHEHQHE